MDDKKIEEIQFSFSIQDIKLLEFSLDNKLLNSKQIDYSVDTLQYEFNMNLKIDSNQDLLLITLNIKIFADIEKTIELGHCISNGNFKILELQKLMNKHNKSLPNVILANLMGLLISTTRGFMIMKCEGTKLEGSFLPVINPMIFFQNKS